MAIPVNRFCNDCREWKPRLKFRKTQDQFGTVHWCCSDCADHRDLTRRFDLFNKQKCG